MGIFDNFFGNNKKKTISNLKNNRENYISIGENIYPVIRDIDDEKIKISIESNNPIIFEKVTDSLIKCYLLDLGDRFEIITKAHLNNFGLSFENMKAPAMRNLKKRVSKLGYGTIDLRDILPDMVPFYTIITDNNFIPSVFLIDEFWDETLKQMKIDLPFISMPTINTLLISDFKIMKSFRALWGYSQNLYQDAKKNGTQLSDKYYIRKDGKWILFLDTLEQFEELY